MNKLKVGIIVEYNHKYYVITDINLASGFASKKNNTLTLFPIPYSTHKGKVIYGDNPKPNEPVKTQIVDDYDVYLVPIDRLLVLK